MPRPFAFNQATFSDRVLVLEVCVPKAAALFLASKATGTTTTDAFEVKSAAAAAAPSLLLLPIPKVLESAASVLAEQQLSPPPATGKVADLLTVDYPQHELKRVPTTHHKGEVKQPPPAVRSEEIREQGRDNDLHH